MVQRLEISGEHLQVDEALKKYVTRKIGRLDRYVSRHNRESLRVEVRLKEQKSGGKKQCICCVVMHLPQETITVKEGTLNMYAAVDIVQAKLKQQLQRYKELHSSGKFRRRLFGRMRRQLSV